MAFKRRKTEEPVLPTDSISDIAFLLIIFFILTTTLSKLTGFSAEMPSGEASKEETKKDDQKTPTVQITNGKVLFNEQEVSMTMLNDRLKDLRLAQKDGEEKIVLLEAGGKVEYQTYYEVLAAVSAAGGIVAIIEEGQ